MPKMDSSIHECGICNEIYNSGDHKPLFLECGHTCCLWCMFQMEKPSGINCPRCRKFTPKQVYQLPVNFDLIPAGDQGSAGTARSAPVALCVNHGSDLDCLCATCGDLVCQHCKKDVHAGHKVKSLRSITGSVKATDARIEFRHKLQRKLDRLTASLTAPRELLQMIEEIKSDVEEWRDSLLASQTSVEQDLRLWDTLGSCPGQEGSVKDVVYRMKRTELSHEYKKRQIKAKLDEVGKKYFEESMTELLPHRGIWMINNEVTAANALMSLTAGREPVESIVTSLPSWPLPQLPKLLKELGEVSVAVDVRLADFFWSPSLEKDPRLQTFIQNYGHKICGFLGSPDDVLAVCHARGEASLVVGVRLATMTDVDRCTALKHTPRSACFIRSLPVNAGVRLKQLHWQPQRFHFPDIQDSDLDWMHCIVKQILPAVQGSKLILPRCRLTENGLRKLLKKYNNQFSYLGCAPISLTREARSRLEAFAREKGINLNWKQY